MMSVKALAGNFYTQLCSTSHPERKELGVRSQKSHAVRNCQSQMVR